MLYPVVPHIDCALWDELGFAANSATCSTPRGPRSTPRALAQDEIELVLQVNGKLRGKLIVPASADNAAIEAAARASARGREARGRRAGEEVIVVPGRLVNVVV